MSIQLQNNIKKLNLHHTIGEFKKLGLNLNRSPSTEYFLNIFNKLYGQLCLNTTTKLLSKISLLKEFGKFDEKTLIENVKIFLYAYVIVINHHEIFGFNSRLEKLLVRSSLDMLYIFIKLCDRIYNSKLDRVEKLLNCFAAKYRKYYKYYQKWKNRDAKELLDVLTYSYYNLSHNLKTIDDNEYLTIKEQIKEIEEKIQYLIIDNSQNKSRVKEYIKKNISYNQIDNICQTAENHYWNIQIYNLENNIRPNQSLREILKIIKKKFKHIPDSNWENSPVPTFLKYLDGKYLDFEIYGNKYFLNMVYYLINIISKLDNADCHDKYKIFAKNFLKKDYTDVIPRFFRDILSKLETY